MNVIWTDELAGAGDIDADGEDVAVVHGMGIGVANPEGGDACAYSV